MIYLCTFGDILRSIFKKLLYQVKQTSKWVHRTDPNVIVLFLLSVYLLTFWFCNTLSCHSSFCIHRVECYYILSIINSHCDLWMIISGGGIAAGWERGEAACCVWAGSVCGWGGSLRAVLRWAGLSLSEENRLVGTRGPPGRSTSHVDGWDQSIRSLPRRWRHQPSG